MVGTIQKFLLGASVLASVSAIASTPAFAISITPTSLTGNFLIYDSNGINTFQVGYTGLSQAQTILEGSCTVGPGNACVPAGSPTGNIELFADSETGAYSKLSDFKNAPVTSLTGTLFGKEITLSSLTGVDWFGPSMDTSYYATGNPNSTFAAKWFNQALDANGASALKTAANFNLFLSLGGFQRFSDPNISYVTQETATSGVLIGLAGHYNAGDAFPPGSIFSILFNNKQASEIVKVTYAGKTDYHYSFNAALSGLTALDDRHSHNGNYEVDPIPPDTTKVPEPSTLLGIIGIGSFLAGKRKMMKKA